MGGCSGFSGYPLSAIIQTISNFNCFFLFFGVIRVLILILLAAIAIAAAAELLYSDSVSLLLSDDWQQQHCEASCAPLPSSSGPFLRSVWLDSSTRGGTEKHQQQYKICLPVGHFVVVQRQEDCQAIHHQTQNKTRAHSRHYHRSSSCVLLHRKLRLSRSSSNDWL